MKGCINCLFILLIIVIVLCASGLLYFYRGCTYTVDKVVRKEVIDYDAGKRYVVHGNNDDYILATDMFLQISPPQDLLDSLKEGETYRFRTCGLRVPLINYYKVIVSYSDVK